jgi:hypothetical protein
MISYKKNERPLKDTAMNSLPCLEMPELEFEEQKETLPKMETRLDRESIEQISVMGIPNSPARPNINDVSLGSNHELQ